MSALKEFVVLLGSTLFIVLIATICAPIDRLYVKDCFLFKDLEAWDNHQPCQIIASGKHKYRYRCPTNLKGLEDFITGSWVIFDMEKKALEEKTKLVSCPEVGYEL